jgi:hypothetical protein
MFLLVMAGQSLHRQQHEIRDCAGVPESGMVREHHLRALGCADGRHWTLAGTGLRGRVFRGDGSVPKTVRDLIFGRV